ncbi:type III-B CRISPR module RAMP protein Cmr6 [Fervidobacterium thailandense]|uniref:type III-B CRISPR module RAMP protein Cmr6 n=1 Tax=Fervidobacterium thailandense TaxID=1008305 RepID=UPI0013018EF3|nr:type III-B CRISPR module RAMP protein Cmr6 [Fervidobacterium thailandense]
MPGIVIEKFVLSRDIFKEVYEVMNKRRDMVVEEFKRKGLLLLDVKKKLSSRLLVGSGAPSILEVGLTLSRNYGLPIVPSSSLKGTFRHYCEDSGILNETELLNVFGTTDQGGGLVFLDAFPTGEVKFGLDVVANHFQPYYMNGEVPNDWYDPVPVKYVTVTSGTYRFTVLIEPTLKKELNEELKVKLKNAFLEMLKVYGVGAKTNYGYGRFLED